MYGYWEEIMRTPYSWQLAEDIGQHVNGGQLTAAHIGQRWGKKNYLTTVWSTTVFAIVFCCSPGPWTEGKIKNRSWNWFGLPCMAPNASFCIKNASCCCTGFLMNFICLGGVIMPWPNKSKTDQSHKEHNWPQGFVWLLGLRPTLNSHTNLLNLALVLCGFLL